MRILPPLKAIVHALRSVIAYRMAGLHIALLWIAILVLLNGAEVLFFDANAENRSIAVARAVTAIVGFAAFSSIAVNWHRFILRDEMPSAANSLRLDGLVLRYAGNSFLALLAGIVPLAVLAAIVALLPGAANIVLLPAALAAGAFVTMLSLKLPAVALGRTDFTFGEALKSAEGNFWRIAAVFLFNGLIVLVPIFAFGALVALIRQANPGLATAIGLLLSIPLNLFITLFSLSVLTSLYGFFVEKRDF